MRRHYVSWRKSLARNGRCSRRNSTSSACASRPSFATTRWAIMQTMTPSSTCWWRGSRASLAAWTKCVATSLKQSYKTASHVCHLWISDGSVATRTDRGESGWLGRRSVRTTFWPTISQIRPGLRNAYLWRSYLKVMIKLKYWIEVDIFVKYIGTLYNLAL